ncbi:MAG: PAS domain S-box protein [Kiritimatiellae bacterium]|nr:PAS domain S-box protein [Kiritimatiellia bacterium]
MFEFWSQDLKAIGTLKADQVAAWRAERLADTARFVRGPTLVRAIENADSADLSTMLKLNCKDGLYHNALLVSAACEILSAAQEQSQPLSPSSRHAVGSAVALQQATLSDFYKNAEGTLNIDCAAPIVNGAGKLLAVLVMQTSASRHIHPFMQSWPGISSTAETLLIRKEGDHVIFLSKMRHKVEGGGNLRLPLTQTHLPAVKALSGYQGIIQGPDYRNKMVLADVRKVPGSDWFIVTKIDKSEILAYLRRNTLVIVGFVMLGIIVVMAAYALEKRARQASRYHALYDQEQAQRMFNEKFRTILYSIGDAVITTDARGHVHQMNPVAEKLTGWSEQEAAGMLLADVFKIINETTKAPVKNPAYRVLQEGRIVGFDNHTLLVARDGAEHPIADSGAPIKNNKGEITGVVIVFRDQTAERTAQKALYESERKLATLLDNLPGMAYRCRYDTYWSMLFVSQGCKELTGYDPSDLVENNKLSYFDIIHPDDRQAVWDSIDGMIKQHSPFTLEYRIISADGTEKWVWERGCAVHAEDGRTVAAIEGLIHDITERKNAASEQIKLQEHVHQVQRLEAVGRLAGGIAHDFNNMLAIILGNAELLQETIDSASQTYGPLSEIIKAGKHAGKIVKQLLGCASKQTVNPQEVDLNHATKELLDTLRHSIGEHIKLEWLPGDDLWPLWIDPAQIDQILVNLVINARDAISDNGQIEVSTSNIKHPQDADGKLLSRSSCDYVMLSVSDNGCGMDETIQAQIFDPFFSTKPNDIRSGLGLPTVYGIVKQNKGHISVESHAGKGSVFKIYLPRHHSPEKAMPEAVAATDGAPQSEQPPTSVTILLVEDEPAVLTLTKILLQKLGYTVLDTNHPKKALSIVREHKGDIQLLLTDVVMPEISGLELSEIVEKQRPGIKKLFMSAYTADIISKHGILCENTNFMEKPFTREVLEQKVREALSK